MPFIGKKIVQNQVTGTDIVDGTLVTADIADGAVSTVKIAADAVDGTKLADNAVNSEHYTDGSIDTAHIADANITTAKLADNAVTTAKITDANISTAKLADDAVTQAKIGADAVGTTELANDVAISTSGAITTTGAFTSVGIDDNADATSITIDANEDVDINNGSLSVSGDATSLTISKTILDRSGNTSRLISGRAGGNYSDLEIHTAGVGGINKQLTMDYQGNTTLHNGNLVIGTSGKGIDFSASSTDGTSVTSEILSDFEIGNWSPTLVNGYAYNGLQAHYTKIGNIVYIYASFYRNGFSTNSNTYTISGLPFTPDTNNKTNSNGLGHWSCYNGSTDRRHGMIDASNDSSLRLIQDGTKANATYDDVAASNGRGITIKWFYYTAS